MKAKKIAIVTVLVLLALAMVAQIYYSYSRINSLESQLETVKHPQKIDNELVSIEFSANKKALGYYTIIIVNKNMNAKVKADFTKNSEAAVVFNTPR